MNNQKEDVVDAIVFRCSREERRNEEGNQEERTAHCHEDPVLLGAQHEIQSLNEQRHQHQHQNEPF